jgi:hypothetical protein
MPLLETLAPRSVPTYAVLAAAVASAAATVPTGPTQVVRASGVVARLTVGGRPASGSNPPPMELRSMVIDCRITALRGSGPREFSVDFGFLRSDPRIRNPRTLNHVRLEIPDVRSDGVVRTFYLEATLGDLGDPQSRTMHVVNTRSVDGRFYGSGSVTVRRSGDTGRFLINAQTHDGVTLTGTIDCANIEER